MPCALDFATACCVADRSRSSSAIESAAVLLFRSIRGSSRIGVGSPVKGMLALGILGPVGAIGGAVAISESKRIGTAPKAATGCKSVMTSIRSGEVLIPTGAVTAGLGYFFAFRHAG